MERLPEQLKQRYGRLSIIEGSSKAVVVRGLITTSVDAICDCGNRKNNILIWYLKKGNTRSCGCLKREKSSVRNHLLFLKHGMSKTRTYRSWTHMLHRCNGKNNHAYERYGGRGITVTKRWEKFENFLEDMGERPEGTSLDRTDNSKGYYKENCRWATPKEQANNRRKNNIIIK